MTQWKCSYLVPTRHSFWCSISMTSFLVICQEANSVEIYTIMYFHLENVFVGVIILTPLVVDVANKSVVGRNQQRMHLDNTLQVKASKHMLRESWIVIYNDENDFHIILWGWTNHVPTRKKHQERINMAYWVIQVW